MTSSAHLSRAVQVPTLQPRQRSPTPVHAPPTTHQAQSPLHLPQRIRPVKAQTH